MRHVIHVTYSPVRSWTQFSLYMLLAFTRMVESTFVMDFILPLPPVSLIVLVFWLDFHQQ